MKADKINLYRDSFTTEKILNYAPTLVYTVWSKVEHKRNWFSENEVWETQEYRLDFRAGGSEYYRSIVKESGTEVIFDANGKRIQSKNNEHHSQSYF